MCAILAHFFSVSTENMSSSGVQLLAAAVAATEPGWANNIELSVGSERVEMTRCEVRGAYR